MLPIVIRYVGNVVLFLLALLLMVFFFIGQEIVDINAFLSSRWNSVFVVFLSIFLEALPFLLIGVLASAFIQLFVSEEMVQRCIPKHSIKALFFAIIAALVTPVCECAIIPVVRRLIQKGVPLHAGVVLLVAAPILNFIVFASTYYAFPNHPALFYGRILLCVITALLVGLFTLIFFNGKVEHVIHNYGELSHSMEGSKTSFSERWREFIQHFSQDFFSVVKYFIIGALIASCLQVFFNRSLLTELGEQSIVGTAAMMGFSYLLSLCSEADAFVAATFVNSFRPEAMLGFLVFGPMLDLKNTFVLFACFKPRFVLMFIIVVTCIVFSLSLLAGVIIEMGGL